MNKTNGVVITLLVILIILVGYVAFRPKEAISPVEEKTKTELDSNTKNDQPVVTPTVSTAMPTKYVSIQDGVWPPVIKNYTAAYSCTPAADGVDGAISTRQKTINGKVYCVTATDEGAAGHRYYNYVYTTGNSSGTKTTSFVIGAVSCGVYGSPDDAVYKECTSTESNFLNNMDSMIDSFMSK